MVRNSTTACATAKPFTPMCSPRGRDYQKNSGLLIWTTSWPYFLTALTTWIEKFEDEMVRNSTTACSTAKPVTPMRSSHGRDYQKNSGLLIWTTSWPYFLTALTTWIASNKRNLKMKIVAWNSFSLYALTPHVTMLIISWCLYTVHCLDGQEGMFCDACCPLEEHAQL